MFKRLNVWYDSLREPRRTLTFFGLFMAWYAPLALGEVLALTPLLYFGAVGLGLMILWALTRI